MTDQRKPKRIVFCFDGTWNKLSAECSTNVVLLAQMVRPIASDGTPQIVYYDEGIGTNMNWLFQHVAGAFGRGMLSIMREAYRFLIFNYEPGDEIFAFGFSRGAYTARSFVGFIRHAGILDVVSAAQIDKAISIYKQAPVGTGHESPSGKTFRAEYCRGVCVSAADRDYRIECITGFDPTKVPILTIRYLGVWDTVRALGVPDFVPGSRWINRKYSFHNAMLTSKIQSARHAVAIDEMRSTFRATLFGRDKVQRLNGRTRHSGKPQMPDWLLPYQEKWFPGVHGAVGGGGSLRGLSDGALEWVLLGARKAGLELRDDRDNPVYALRPNPFDPLQNFSKAPFMMRGPIGAFRRLLRSPRKGPAELDEIAISTLRRWYAPPESLSDKQAYRPGALAACINKMTNWPYGNPPEWKAKGVTLKEYTVVYGDTLSKLALTVLGDVKLWKDLFELNRDRVDDPDNLSIGSTLRLPDMG